MAHLNGLLPPFLTHAAPDSCYYLRDNQANVTLTTPTLKTPVKLQSATELPNAVPATILTKGSNHGLEAYVGAVQLNAGGNTAGPDGSIGLTLRTAAGGVAVEVGTEGQATNQLLIAGPDGLGQVYDEVYNQPVALQPITMVVQNPNTARSPSNTSEIFRCNQTAVAAADAGVGQGNTFQVPKTGFYALQIELDLFNAVAPAPPSINIPAIVAAGIDVYGSLSFSLTDGGSVVLPYGAHEFVGGELFTSDCLVAGEGVTKIHTGMYLLSAGQTYGIVMGAHRPAGSTAWNIGDAGVIKAELIAMC